MAEKWKVDFSKVEDKSTDITAGKYVVKVKAIDKKEGTEYPYLEWTLVIGNGKFKGLHLTHRTTMKPSGLFNLRNTLMALGFDVPKSAISLDPAKLIGKIMGVDVILEPYEGNMYPKIKKTWKYEAVEAAILDEKKVVDTSDDVVIDMDDDDVPY